MNIAPGTPPSEPTLEQLRAASHDSPQAFAAYAYRLRALSSPRDVRVEPAASAPEPAA